MSIPEKHTLVVVHDIDSVQGIYVVPDSWFLKHGLEKDYDLSETLQETRPELYEELTNFPELAHSYKVVHLY